MTSGQIIDAVLKYYVNVGSSITTTDIELRQRAQFHLNNACEDLWAAAPWWWKLADGTVSVAAGGTYGVAPADFDGRFGTQGGVFMASSALQPSPTWASPGEIALLRQQAPMTATPPWRYSIFGRDTSTFRPLIQVYPTAGAAYTLNLTNYVKAPPVLVDKPTALTCAAGASVGVGLGLTGVYSYVVTFVINSGDGETEAGVVSENVTVTDTAINLSAIPVSPLNEVTGRNIYRTTAGGSTYKLVVSLTNNTATTYVDSVADISLGVAPPTPAEAITGTEDFPNPFHSGLLYDYAVFEMAMAQGDMREKAWRDDWRKDVKRQWSEFKQGSQVTQVMPRYGQMRGYQSSPFYRPRPLGS